MVSAVPCKPSIFDGRPERKISARGRSCAGARENRARQNDAHLLPLCPDTTKSRVPLPYYTRCTRRPMNRGLRWRAHDDGYFTRSSSDRATITVPRNRYQGHVEHTDNSERISNTDPATFCPGLDFRSFNVTNVRESFRSKRYVIPRLYRPRVSRHHK